MRRAAIAFLLLSACASPRIHVTPAFPAGATRMYELVARATTTIDAAGSPRRVDRTELRARSTIEVIEITGGTTTIRLTLVPERFTRNGEVRSIQQQQAELLVAADGTISGIRSVGGLPPESAGTSAEDLAPILGAPYPTGRLRIGSTWRRALPVPLSTEQPGLVPVQVEPGTQRGRVVALRRVEGYDCAVLELGTERQLARQFTVDAQPIQLTGTELSRATISFAFRRGFPVLIETDAEARFTVSGAPDAGSVTIASETTLALVGATS